MNPLGTPRLDGDAVERETSQPSGGWRRVPSVALFQGNREVVILHRGQEYRLRITKADKLILTK